MQGVSDEGMNAQCAPAFQLIRRKRPRTPDSNVGYRAFSAPDKAPRLMILPGLAELLAAQKQRNDNVMADELLGTLSCVPTAGQKQTVAQVSEKEREMEDKSPWPSATQYFDIFSRLTGKLNIPIYDLGVDPRGVPLHPEFIYNQPVSCMYFLKCSRLLGKGSFGFPRKRKLSSETTPMFASKKGGKNESSKDFEWRKMSFVTGLPKKRPIVRYITATCYSRATQISAKKKVFRMHAVMLADEMGTGEHGEYVLVHIRAGGCKRVGLRASAETHEENVKLLGTEPVSPTSVAVTSYSSLTASTAIRNKKKGHAESTGEAVPATCHPATTTEEVNVDSARLALRELVLKSCSSRDEMVKYVIGLQEELAALQEES